MKKELYGTHDGIGDQILKMAPPPQAMDGNWEWDDMMSFKMINVYGLMMCKLI